MSGLFVTFEGGEGSGKSTQVARLSERLRARGVPVLVSREPGGTPLAERVRTLLLGDSVGGAASPGPWAEAFLMVAARADLVARVIRPALEASSVVLCDRYTDSTLAYQGAGRGLDLELLAAMNRAATGGLAPDATLLFDIDPHAGLARRHGSGNAANRLDREPPEFHTRVRECYLTLARDEPERFVVLDAGEASDALEARVWAAIEPRIRAVVR